MTEIYCKYCGRKIDVSITNTQKDGKCPNCKKPIIATETKPAYDFTLLEVPEELKDQILQSEQRDIDETTGEKTIELEKKPPAKDKNAAKRILPWPVDIFLYPISKPGLTNLIVLAGVPLLIDLLSYLSIGLLYAMTAIRPIVGIVLFLYLNWYIAECIRDSADGWVRAPEGISSLPDLSDMFNQTVNVVGCLFMLVGPYLIYRLLTGGTDLISILLLGVAITLYPMGLLAVVQFDSVSGVHPRILFSSIRKTALPYAGIILYILILLLLIRKIARDLITSVFSKFGYTFLTVYLILVCAHLLGRLYWCHQDQLKWDLPGETVKKDTDE